MRRDVESLTTAEVDALRAGFQTLYGLEDDRGYASIAGIHGLPLPMYSRHDSDEFLPWHRVYAWMFEQLLLNVGGQALPYWDWTSERSHREGIPAAFAEPHLPSGQPNPLAGTVIPAGIGTGEITAPPATMRAPGDPKLLPNRGETEAVLRMDAFEPFRIALEDLHNRVHAWVGGTFNGVPFSAYDPLSWAHMAMVDRLWWLWQREHGLAIPGLDGKQTLAPFSVALGDVLDTRALGYTYESTEARRRSILAGYRSDSVGGPDALGIERDVEALCMVLAAHNIQPPLSIGLFGDWGSGKSFFIDRMQRRVERLAQLSRAAVASGEETYFCRDICQVTFNAWHYADANLWASLGSHIFDSLSVPEGADARAAQEASSRRASLARQLAEARVEGERIAAEATARSVGQRLHRLGDEFGGRRARAELAAGRTLTGETGEDLQWLADSNTVGLSDADRATVRDVAELASGLGTLPGLLAQLGREVRNWWPGPTALAWAAAFGVVLAAAVAAVVLSRAWNLAWVPGLGLLLGLVAMLRTPLRQVSQAVRRARRLAQELRAREAEERAALEERRRAAEARVAELERSIASLQSGRQLYQFIAERSGSGEYRSRLGVVDMVRRDFDQLSSLMRRQRLEEDGAAADPELPRIDLIVLYIDDLDRCPPSRVVQVLEAVHLLLAMPLFVVVVAVDVRWLLQSLEHHYSSLLAGGGDAELSDEERARWSATAMNYLEKIFQVPFTLRQMDATAYERLIDDLVPMARPTDGDGAGASGVAAGAVSGASGGPGAGQPAVGGTAAREPVDLVPAGLVIDALEQAWLKRLAPLVETPRDAKRLTNTYRLVRASVEADQLEAFVAGGQHAIVLTLLGVMVGHPRLAARLFQLLTTDQERFDSWSKLLRAAAAEDEGWRAPIAALEKLRQETAVPDSSLEEWRRWVPLVARYSFQAGHAVEVPPAEQEAETPAAQPGRNRRATRRPARQ